MFLRLRWYRNAQNVSGHEVNSLQFLGHSEVHASPDKDEAVEAGVADGALHGDAAGVASELLNGCLTSGGHLGIGGLGGEIFQLKHV